MESTIVKQRFIQLRAEGLSFDKIAKDLGKAKQTLIDWSKELEEEISNRKAIELENLYQIHYLTKEARIKNYGTLLSKITAEINTRDLKDIHTSKLLELYLQYTEKAKDEVIEPIFKSSKELTEDKLNRLLLEDLIAPPDTTVKLKVG
jgi:transcriptional regulator with XRE-family HTH domain